MPAPPEPAHDAEKPRDARDAEVLDAAVRGLSALVVAGDSYRRAAADHVGLTVVETHAVSYVDTYGPMTQTRLATLMDLTRGAVTGLVDRLERLGMARRAADPTDRRRHRIELTDQAVTVLAESRSSLVRAFDQVPPSVLHALVDALPLLAAGVQHEADVLREP